MQAAWLAGELQLPVGLAARAAHVCPRLVVVQLPQSRAGRADSGEQFTLLSGR